MRGRPLRIAVLLVVAALVLVTSATARDRQPGEQAVRVSGALSPVGDGYTLNVEYDAGTNPGFYQAIMVRAQPSGTLLMAQYSPDTRLGRKLRQDFSGALVSINATLDTFTHSAFLPYNPLMLGDNRVTVTLVRNGKAILLSDGQVDVGDFSFTTYFHPEYLGQPTPPNGLFFKGECPPNQIMHCCEGGNNCEKQCVCCQGPSFFCNLITCEEPTCLDH